MELNQKMINIINLLASSDGKVSLDELTQRCSFSKRTLYYNIEKINTWLLVNSFKPLHLKDGYLYLQKNQIESVLKELAVYDEMHYVLSVEERQALLIFLTGLSQIPVTVEYLNTVLNISRNTVLSEVAELRNILSKKDIILFSRGKYGYQLSGDETTIRYLLMDYFYQMSVKITKNIAMEILGTAVKHLSGINMDENILSRISKIVENADRQISGKLNNYSLTETTIYILLIYVRSQSGYFSNSSIQIEDGCLEYKAAGIILRDIKELGIIIKETEQLYLATVLLGSKVYDFRAEAAVKNELLKSMTWDIIETFETKACVKFHDKEELFGRLFLHIKPMYYRLKYKIRVENLFADEISQKYRELYNLTDLVMKTVQSKYELVIPDEEIAYICIYIGGWLRKNVRDQADSFQRLLLVCNYGVGTSLLLKEQLLKILGYRYQYEIQDERQFSESDISLYSLIITTVNLNVEAKNIIVVSPIITNGQKQKLLDWSLKSGQQSSITNLEQIIDVVRKHSSISNESALIADLLKVVHDGDMIDEKEKLRLRDVLTLEHIMINRTLVREEEAIEIACKTLVQSGAVEPGYAASIAGIIEGMGLYSELSPGIMLAHGKPNETVHKVGLSLTLFQEPVLFQKWNRRIHVIFTLAAIDNEQHFDVLKDLMIFLKKDENCKKLNACDFISEKDVYNYLIAAMEETNDKEIS